MKKSISLNGAAAVPGVAIGKAYLVDEDHLKIVRRYLKDYEIQEEIRIFKDALNETESDILEMKKHFIDLSYEKGEIFDAHLQMIKDESMIKKTIDKIKKDKENVDYIFYNHMIEIQNNLLKSKDEYLQERAQDIKDLKRRVIRKIQGEDHSPFANLEEKSVVIARNLTPFDSVTFDRTMALGFAVERGGITSHAVILARALNIPSVVGIDNLLQIIKPDDTIILNGFTGELIINPSKEVLESYRKLKMSLEDRKKELNKIVHLPAKTIDGREIELSANIELPHETDQLIKVGAKGVGLYRTEYLFLTEKKIPSEETQMKIYQKISKVVYPDFAIIRTIDLGGDKLFSDTYERERNPFLGWRAIRVCLEKTDIFKNQLRAILRASVLKNIRIMLPFIATMEELTDSKLLLEEVKEELRNNKIEFDENIQLGIMIEIPSAVLIAGHLAKEADFFSIGTNDLIQYTLAVDRINHKVSGLYQTYNPAVLRLIKDTIQAGHENNIWVGLCGEMAAVKHMVPILVGLGIDKLSVSPVFLPQVKEVIRAVKYEDMKNTSEECLKFKTAEEVENFITNKMCHILPRIFKEPINYGNINK